MKIANVGKDELSSYNFESLNKNRPLDIAIQSIVYSYENGGYDGNGLAVYLDTNGDYHLDELGHCSCYGPFDDGFNKITYTRQQIIELLRSKSNASYGGQHAKAILNTMEAQL